MLGHLKNIYGLTNISDFIIYFHESCFFFCACNLRKINHTGWILLTTHLKLLFVTHEIHFLSSLLCTQGNIKETGVGLNRIRMKLLRWVGVTQAGKYSQTDDRMIGWWVCKKRGAHLTPASSSQTHKAPQHFYVYRSHASVLRFSLD